MSLTNLTTSLKFINAPNISFNTCAYHHIVWPGMNRLANIMDDVVADKVSKQPAFVNEGAK